MPVKRLSITITGRVQGVGYRYFAQDAANALGLSGWVRNNFDRSVECEVQGEAADSEALLRELARRSAAFKGNKRRILRITCS